MTSPEPSTPKPVPPTKASCGDMNEKPKGRTHFCTKASDHTASVIVATKRHLCPCGESWWG